MTSHDMTRRAAVALGLGGLLGLGVASARAQDAAFASDWAGQKNGRIRLLAGTAGLPGNTPQLYAGIHITLAKDWKTYWRLPGDAGVPPSFDWTGSTNVKDVRVLYPVPMRLPEAGMMTLGYKGDVVFPVAVTPQEPGKPVELKLAAEYGVCRDICIPAEATLSLTLPTDKSSAPSSLITAHLRRVPFPSSASGGPQLLSLNTELSSGAPRLVIDAVFPKGSDGAEVLIERVGGALGPFTTVVDRLGRDRIRLEARFANAAEAQRFAGTPLILTLFSAHEQAEVRAQLPRG